MENIKLTIDLLPRGAWGNDLSKALSKKDWDKLRNYSYKKANHKCAICGEENGELNAHEEWDFDIPSKTQTLKDIIALCTACHGVKHMRNSERIGYGEHAKSHFMKVNRCNAMSFAKHYSETQFVFEERNKVLRWKIKASLDEFGGKGIELKERYLPLIKNPYDKTDWDSAESNALFQYIANNINEPNSNTCYPKVRKIEVDNYDGTITVTSDYANKIEWINGDSNIKRKFNTIGTFKTKICVENLTNKSLYFVLTGDGGKTFSSKFELNDPVL